MSKQQKKYDIEIRYPQSEDEMLALRKQLGAAYLEFIKEYLDAQSLTPEEIQFIYKQVIRKLQSPPP